MKVAGGRLGVHGQLRAQHPAVVGDGLISGRYTSGLASGPVALLSQGSAWSVP